jgi:hypothetical protein
MIANAAAAGEIERAEEISEGRHIPIPEPALRRALSTLSRADHKRGWSKIGQSMNPPENFAKNL